MSSSLLYYDGYNARNEHDNVYGISVTDNSDDLLLSGAYIYAHQTRSFATRNDLVEEYHQLSMGQFLFKHFSLGASLIYLTSEISSVGKYEQINGHLGAFYNPAPDIALAFVAYNVAGRTKGVPAEVEQGNKLALGVVWVADPLLRVRFDVSQMQVQNPDRQFEYQLGLESKTSDYFLFRGGVDQDDWAQRKYWSMGVGFDGPRAKIDYFYRKNFEFGSAALHGVDIRVPFW